MPPQSDLESLLLWDRKLDIEIYAEYLCREPVHVESALGPKDDFKSFLVDTGFPDHGVIVHPEESLSPIFKGLHSESDVAQGKLDCFMASTTGKVVISTDLRANHNLTRRGAIRRAGINLLEKLNSLCPGCGLPGFALTRGIPGLRCSGCEEASQVAEKVLFECVKCPQSENRPRDWCCARTCFFGGRFKDQNRTQSSIDSLYPDIPSEWRRTTKHSV